MRKSIVLLCLIPVLSAVILGQLKARWNQTGETIRHTFLVRSALEPVGEVGGKQVGPDIIVSKMQFISKQGTVGNITGYAFSTTSCNIGDVGAEFIIDDPPRNHHPLIAQNMYRYMNGRFEQIGLAWLKHAFCAFDESDPLNCLPCMPDGSCEVLVPGCSDTYGTFSNSQQARLGPRSEVNAVTGVFPYPYGLQWQQTGDAIFKRLQIDNNDLDPALNPGARYFMEGMYLTTDEPAWGTQFNNASYRECFVGAFQGSGYVLAYGAPTIQKEKTAIEAWQEVDPLVQFALLEVAGEGQLTLGSRVTDNGDGTWRYEYAVYNYNSDRSGGSFSIPLDPCVTVANIGFHDVEYHSGEPFSVVDWGVLVAPDSITWSTDDFATDANANALRFNTLYNFSFDADSPPVDDVATLGLFKPGAEATVTGSAQTPGSRQCPANIAGGDSSVNVSDLLFLLAEWGVDFGSSADISSPGYGCPDTHVDVSDLLFLLSGWGPCP